jgi:hypothetical protein
VRLLLDTHVVLWELEGSRTVEPVARHAIERATELAFSVVSFAEIGVKASIGKLVVPRDLHDRPAERPADPRPRPRSRPPGRRPPATPPRSVRPPPHLSGPLRGPRHRHCRPPVCGLRCRDHRRGKLTRRFTPPPRDEERRRTKRAETSRALCSISARAGARIRLLEVYRQLGGPMPGPPSLCD